MVSSAETIRNNRFLVTKKYYTMLSYYWARFICVVIFVARKIMFDRFLALGRGVNFSSVGHV